MNLQLRTASIKFKLMGLLLSLTVGILCVYAWMAITNMQKDKVAYVFDTALGVAQSTANQVRSELGYLSEHLKFLVRGYSEQSKEFHSFTKKIFAWDKYSDALVSFQWDESANKYLRAASILKPGAQLVNDQDLETLLARLQQNDLAIYFDAAQPDRWFMGLRLQTSKDKKPVIIIARMQYGDFISSFTKQNMFDIYLVSGGKEIIASQVQTSYQLPKDSLNNILNQVSGRIKASDGVFEVKTNDRSKWLVAVSAIGMSQLSVIALISKAAAMEAVYFLLLKSALLLVFLICIAVILSVFASSQLTASLRSLVNATQKVATGDFKVKLPVTSKDEVGVLSQSFNTMTEEIVRLMAETAENARMSNELKTAQLVQSTLFPEKEFSNRRINIVGFYEPASECGGDWWSYHNHGDKTYLFIGDATGHGVPAALVTSAARSAASILEQFPELTIEQVMGHLNKAIYASTKGKILMTFFLACFNEATGELSYCNASHDPPIYLPHQESGSLKKADLKILMSTNGPRLGQSPDSVYKSVSLKLNPGDKIMFFTDGVTELVNHEGKLWGERKFLNCLVTGSNNTKDLSGVMQNLETEMTAFRNNAPLSDDVTYFMFQFKNS